MIRKLFSLTVLLFVLATVASVIIATPASADVSPHCALKPSKVRLASPANGTSVLFTQQTLDWNDVRCATTYKVIIRMDAKNGPIVAKASGLEKPSYVTNLKTLAPGHTYFWRVKACNHFGCSRSPQFSFHVLPGELPKGQ